MCQARFRVHGFSSTVEVEHLSQPGAPRSLMSCRPGCCENHGLDPDEGWLWDFVELKPDCVNPSSTHADRAAAREQQIQPLKERVQRQTPERIGDVPVDTDKSARSKRYRRRLRFFKPSTPTRSWMYQRQEPIITTTQKTVEDPQTQSDQKVTSCSAVYVVRALT